MRDERLLRKVLEYRERLERLLENEAILYSMLMDPEIRDDLLFVLGALRIRVRLAAPSAARGASLVSRPAS